MESLNPGDTSKELSSLGSAANTGFNCIFLFRTSFKDGDASITFFTTKKSKIIVLLTKDRGGYRTEIIDE